MTQTIVYSAIYGRYDDPKPLPAALSCPAVMITDSDETAHRADQLGWMSVVNRHGIATCNGDPARVAPMLAHKYWKTHPLELGAGEVALWVDGSIALTRPDFPELCLQALGGDDLAAMRHPWRHCALDEGDYSATLPRYAGTGVDRQTEFYRGFHPKGWGLAATGVLAWRINEVTRDFGELWWRECLNWSHQDQVSLPVLLRLSDRGEAGLSMKRSLDWNLNIPWEEWWTLGHHKVAP